MSRSLIPIAHRTLEDWPKPDIHVLSGVQQSKYLKRQEAIQLYAEGTAFDSIQAITGISCTEVRRLIRRCTKYCGDGHIYGFYALLPGFRVGTYTRQTIVDHTPGTDCGGCAGALEQLFDRFPDVRAYVHALYFKEPGTDFIHESRISIVELHKRFMKKLRERKFSDADWPFNTSNRGYKSLVKYCRVLRETNSSRAMAARSGMDAAWRQQIDHGYKRFLPLIRPYSHLELDFHKVDAASIIVIENAHGVELEIPVSRWYFGALICEQAHAIVGLYITLEKTPSADCTLETVESALRPEEFLAEDPQWRYAEDGKVLIHQILPELEWQSFSALKVDNAWSNSANEVINNIIDTVGCAVNFGPVKAWWRRQFIEKTFGELERRGLQRLPSTHGAGPGDTRKADPNGQAIRFKIRLTELVAIIYGCAKEHNLEATEGLNWASPVQVMQAALSRPASGFFRLPLPRPTQQHMPMMQHLEVVTVRGDLNKGKRPYFKSDRCLYRNQKLANSYHLIGKQLLVYINRRDSRIAYASVISTGQDLGQMFPEEKWSKVRCSWRLRKLVNRAGFAKAYWSETESPVTRWAYDKVKDLKKKRTKKGGTPLKTSSSDALALARVVRNSTRSIPERFEESPNMKLSDIPSVKVQKPTSLPNPFGLNVRSSKFIPLKK